MGEYDIAVIGMSGRFPGAPDLDTYWRNLVDGVCSVRRHSHADLLRAGVPRRTVLDPSFVPADGYLDDADTFDAAFFGIGEREATLTDPQHRLFLECAWHALEDAGHPPAAQRLAVGCFASAGMSLYAGARMSSYLTEAVLRDSDLVEGSVVPLVSIANRDDYLATRVAYQLGLRGPAVNVQAACASSLVAVHLAVQSLLAGECDMALAGAAAVHVPLASGYLHQPGGMLSATGVCRPFDAAADGTVGGNGVGVVVLRRAADAFAAGDPVRALVTGSAINNDGRDKASFTAPSVRGQREVIAAAHRLTGRSADSLGFVETHGTATRLGDPIEIRALRLALGTTSDALPCALGAVKANIGHLDSAAGIAAFIKTVLAVQHGVIPPVINHERRNPEIDLTGSPLYVPLAAGPWPSAATARRAAVSAFGAGGTNAHVVVEQAPDRAERPVVPGPHLITVSARDPVALRSSATRLAQRLAADPPDLADVSLTTLAGRSPLGTSLSVVADDPADAAAALVRAADAVDDEQAPAAVPAGRPVVLLFPGQGADNWAGLRRWITADADFRTAMRELCGPDLLPLLEAEPGDPRRKLARYVQPALVAAGIALAASLLRAGVRPALVLGHSLGELAAAAIAGILDPADAVALAATRGRLLDERCAPGAMLLAATDEPTARRAVTSGEVSVAAINSATSTVLSGPAADVARARAALSDLGIRTSILPTTHAYHSALVEPAVSGVTAAAAALSLRRPTVPMLSSATATVSDAPADPAYWGRQLRDPVRFADAVRDPGPPEHAAILDDAVFVDLGEGGVLAALVAANRPDSGGRLVRIDRGDTAPPVPRLLSRLGQQGVPVDWSTTALGRGARRVSLPGYPFHRTRHWPRRDQPATPADQPVRLTRVTWTPVAPTEGPPFRRPVVLLPTGLTGHGLPRDGEVLRDWDSRLRRDRADAARLLDAALVGADAVIDLTALGTPSDEWLGPRSAVVVTAALGRTVHPPTVVTVTTRAVAVPGGGPVRPDQAAVWGLVRALRTEHRDATMRLVDVAAPDTAVAARLGRSGPAELALRGTVWLSPILVEIPAGPPVFGGSLDGVLLAGGTGGLGVHLASWCAEHGARRIILAARTAPTAQQLATIGSDVRFERADVALPADVQRLGAAFRDVPLSLVVAGAGVLRDAVGARITDADLATVYAPKVTGTRLLAELAAEHGCPILAMSSLAALLGAPGQGAYAAANAAMEATVVRAGANAISIGWGPWRGTGMSRTLTGSEGPRPLPPADWLTVLDRLPAGLSGPVHALPEPASTGTPTPAEVATALWTAPDDTPSTSDWQRAVADGDADRFVVRLVARLLRRPAHLVASDMPFADLGMDSLAGLRLRQNLVEATGIPLPDTLIYQHPTPKAVSAHLLSVDAPPPDTTRPAAEPSATDTLRLLADLRQEIARGRADLRTTAEREDT